MMQAYYEIQHCDLDIANAQVHALSHRESIQSAHGLMSDSK
jgi:hypothetical protein